MNHYLALPCSDHQALIIFNEYSVRIPDGSVDPTCLFISDGRMDRHQYERAEEWQMGTSQERRKL